MARVLDGLRPAGLASLLLHGGAVLAMLAGLPPPPAPPVPQVIEIAFLPPADAAAEPLAEAASMAPVAETAEAAPDAPVEPVAETSESPPGTPPAPLEAEHPAPTPDPARSPEEPPRPGPPPVPSPRARAAAPHAPRQTAREPAAAAASTSVAAPAPTASPAPPRAVPHSYIAALFAALDRRKEYPESARWRRAEGTALLRVSLHRDGSVQAWRIERGSGHEDLDQAIGAMVRRASPLPAPPADLPGDPVEFSIPVRFSLR